MRLCGVCSEPVDCEKQICPDLVGATVIEHRIPDHKRDQECYRIVKGPCGRLHGAELHHGRVQYLLRLAARQGHEEPREVTLQRLGFRQRQTYKLVSYARGYRVAGIS